MFTTQFSSRKHRGEHSTADTLVSLVPCSSNQERITQSLLTGALVQAANVGYDYKSDEKIKDIMFDVEKRSIDIVQRLEGVQYVRGKVEDYIRSKTKVDEDEKPALDKMAKVVHNEPKQAVSSQTDDEGQV